MFAGSIGPASVLPIFLSLFCASVLAIRLLLEELLSSSIQSSQSTSGCGGVYRDGTPQSSKTIVRILSRKEVGGAQQILRGSNFYGVSRVFLPCNSNS